MLRAGAACVAAVSLLGTSCSGSTGEDPAVGTSPPPQAISRSADAPNILIIVTDDQRDDLSTMPETARLFRDEGLDLENGFVTTPICCPSRASIFTGRYAHNHGVERLAESADLDQTTTIQHHLQRAGYRTALFGKYLADWPQGQAPPYFDDWAFFRKSSYSYSGGPWNVGGTVKTVDRYSTSFIKDKAIDFLERSEGDEAEPWFLYLAPGAPHAPSTPEERYKDTPVPPWRPTPAMLEEDRSDKPPYVRDQDSKPKLSQKIRRRQLRSLRSVDDLVRRVFAKLEAAGEDRDTLAFFLSDNGFLWGDHRLSRKAAPYTGSIEVPFMVRWPGHLRAGDVDPRLAANIDIAPTIAEAVGMPQELTDAMDGRSLLDRGRGRDHILSEYFADFRGPDPNVSSLPSPTWASLRDESYQYIENYDEDGIVTFTEYYDLVRDPFQLLNLLGDDDPRNDPPPRRITQLHELLSAERLCRGTSGPHACP